MEKNFRMTLYILPTKKKKQKTPKDTTNQKKKKKKIKKERKTQIGYREFGVCRHFFLFLTLPVTEGSQYNTMKMLF